MHNRILLLALLTTVGLAGCDAFSDAMTAHENLVARAAGHEFQIDEAAALLAQNARLPADPAVVEAVANLWVDYVLLASAASEDSTLGSIELAPIIEPELEQRMVFQLRDRVVQIDTTVSEDELRRLFEQEQPDLAVRARHILIRVSPQAPASERDSARALIESLQARAAAGEDFAALAREFSEDPGSAERGGDLGFFRRGDMVGPFEEAAFALDVGEVSEVVETPFGYHVIKVEERQAPEFGESREEFRGFVLQRRQAEAEQEYIESLTGPLDLRVGEGAAAVVQELARNPTSDLSRRAGARELVSYEEGALTAAEFLDFMRQLPPNRRSGYASAQPEQIEQVLEGLATNEILIAEAREQGLAPSAQARDSIEANVREQLRTAVSASNLGAITPQEGETRAQAVDRRVTAMIGEIIRGERQVLPLGPISYTLREQYDAEIFQRSFPQVVSRVQAIRAEEMPDAPAGQPPAGQQGAADTAASPVPPDTTQG
ncbi:MAG: peptidylprolyl isomerase [Longimicrobiales bacterium]